ncbi:MAG: FtsX-like permease family protein [Gammaproteobacteria bacterium]|nr:FtsX-like permease family protein [Gammaproteobacteria bacterium]
MLELRPILSALWQSKTAALLIALQLMLTLTIVSNAALFIHNRQEKIARPTGMAEKDILAVNFSALAKNYEMPAAVDADLALIRSIPSVIEATHSHKIPLSGSGESLSLFLEPNANKGGFSASYFYVGAGVTEALGMELIAGRDFKATDVQVGDHTSRNTLNAVIVTQQFARQLYPDAHAVGKYLYTGNNNQPIKIIGIVARNLGPHLHQAMAGNTVFFPQLMVVDGSASMTYLVRSEPGQLQEVFNQLEGKLRVRDPQRIISLRTLEAYKKRSYRADNTTIEVLATVITLLATIIALGILGLTSFWVSQRRKQIGVRRALGASRRAIARYFLIENLMVAGTGIALGLAAAQLANKVLVMYFNQPALPLPLLLGCALILLVISLGAALSPALRAANISPALATRSV